MADNLFQVRFPTQVLSLRTADVLIDRQKAAEIFTRQVTDFIRANIEVTNMEQVEPVQAQWGDVSLPVMDNADVPQSAEGSDRESV